MCKIKNVNVGIKKLDFSTYRGKLVAFLTDGREVIVPLSFFPDIKNLPLSKRKEWMILDDQLLHLCSFEQGVLCRRFDENSLAYKHNVIKYAP